MHGLMNRAIQCFVRDTYGAGAWSAVTREAGLGFESFEPMLHYDPALTDSVVAAACRLLDRPREVLLEDLGTYLVSHPNVEGLRRLLRFGGVDFADFLESLEELRGRGRLALPDLDLPVLSLAEEGPNRFVLTCQSPIPGAGHVVVGLLRAMADDYGSLVLLEHRGGGGGTERIGITLSAPRFSEGRAFDLGARRFGQ